MKMDRFRYVFFLLLEKKGAPLDNKRPSSNGWKYPKLFTEIFKTHGIVQWKHYNDTKSTQPAIIYTGYWPKKTTYCKNSAYMWVPSLFNKFFVVVAHFNQYN